MGKWDVADLSVIRIPVLLVIREPASFLSGDLGGPRRTPRAGQLGEGHPQPRTLKIGGVLFHQRGKGSVMATLVTLAYSVE